MLTFLFHTLGLIGLDYSYLNELTLQASVEIRNNNHLPSVFIGLFLGAMLVMAIYNLLLYFSLKDKAYLLYVGTTIFAVLTNISIHRLGDQFFWPNSNYTDASLYITFAGISMFFSSRFAAEFLQLKKAHKHLNSFMWAIASLSLLLTVLSLVLTIEQVTPFGRWLVLLSFPSYIIVAIIAYKKGFFPAKFYIVAWIPYVVGLVIRTMHGAGWLPTNQLVLSSIEIGGALEIVLLSFALADRIKSLQKENTQIRTQLQEYISQVLNLEKKIESNSSNNTHSPEGRIQEIATKNQLTERETDILLQISLGKNNQQIADELFVSVNTIKFHIRNIYEKLNVNKRSEVTSKILFDK